MRSQARRTGLLAVASLLCLPLAAAATLIVPVSQTRTVSASAQTDGGLLSSSSFSAPDFGPFDQTAAAQSYHPVYTLAHVDASTRQISTIQDNRLTVEVRSGKAFGLSGGGGGFPVGGALAVDSLYDVTFDITEPVRFSILKGIFLEPFESAELAVSLLDGNGQLILQPPTETVPSPGYWPIGTPTTGVLSPGRYRLIADWNWPYFFGDAVELRGYLDFSVTPIPEPGTALLLALGLGALAAGRARRES